MDKIDLIAKEKKQCRIYLNRLYEELKQADANHLNDKAKKNIYNEIEANIQIRDLLTNLQTAFVAGNGEAELAKLTKETDEEYTSLMASIQNKNPKNYTQKYYRVKELKECLDNINGIFLSKMEIYEYLRNYNEVMRLAIDNIYLPIEKTFMSYMESTNQKDKANHNYYMNMIKIHILFTNVSIATNIKDDDFAFIDNQDSEMSSTDKNGDLSFLKDCFISPTDSPKFLKSMVFNYIRNAFCHSDNLDLYQISTSCNSVFINLQNTVPIPFRVKITANDIHRMARSISSYSHHLSSFYVKNQEQIDVSKLGESYQACSDELDKVLMTRISLSKGTEHKQTIFEDIDDSKTIFDPNNMLGILSKYGIVTETDYGLSDLSKHIFYDKFKLMEPYIQKMEFYIVPIITNYIQNGVFKNMYLLYEAATSYTYLFNGNNSMRTILSDMANDFDTIIMRRSIPKGKKSVFNYLAKDIDYEKALLMYMFDNQERKNINDVLLLKYVFGSMNDEETISIGGNDYPSVHIRDALIHGRYTCYTENGELYYSMYDDEDMMVDPDKAYWTATFKYSDLEKASLDTVTKYAKKSTNKGI